jgi:hypothetical protein
MPSGDKSMKLLLMLILICACSLDIRRYDKKKSEDLNYYSLPQGRRYVPYTNYRFNCFGDHSTHYYTFPARDLPSALPYYLSEQGMSHYQISFCYYRRPSYGLDGLFFEDQDFFATVRFP